MKLQLFGESKLDLAALSLDDDTRIYLDKSASKLNEKFSLLSRRLLGEDYTRRHLHLLFYFELPQELIDLIINENSVKVNFANEGILAKGFFSGSVDAYARLIAYACKEGTDQKLRIFGNLLFGYLKGKFPILTDQTVRQLHDRTFALVPT